MSHLELLDGTLWKYFNLSISSCLRICGYRNSGEITRTDNVATLQIPVLRAGQSLAEFIEIGRSFEDEFGEATSEMIVAESPWEIPKVIRNSARSSHENVLLIDPRWGPRHTLLHFVWTFLLIWPIWENKSLVVCPLPDFARKSWLFMVSVLTARRGVVVGLVDGKTMKHYFRQGSMLSPCPPALSVVCRRKLGNDILDWSAPLVITLNGTLYEPRSRIFNEIGGELAGRGISYRVHFRELGSRRDPRSRSSYFDSLETSHITITTARHAYRSGYASHFLGPHCVYRIAEALLAGTLLFIDLGEIEEWNLYPGRTHMRYRNPQELADLVQFCEKNRQEAKSIAKCGQRTMRELLDNRGYWKRIVSSLDDNSE